MKSDNLLKPPFVFIPDGTEIHFKHYDSDGNKRECIYITNGDLKLVEDPNHDRLCLSMEELNEDDFKRIYK